MTRVFKLAISAAAAAVIVALSLTACGSSKSSTAGGAAPSSSARVVQIDMTDIAFSPTEVSVPGDRRVTFEFHNKGKLTHEALLGDAKAQDEHEKMMSGSKSMDMSGADEVTVKPGKTGTLSHTFHPGDHLLIGCHQPGHYAAGMKISITVT